MSQPASNKRLLRSFFFSIFELGGITKHSMTGPAGNSAFCFPVTLNVPRGEAEGNIEVEGKQNSLFPTEPVIKCFVIPPKSKIENETAKTCLLGASWHNKFAAV